MKAFKATWLGDGDPAMPVIEIGDLTFVKGEAVDVPAGHAFAERIEGNPAFAIDDKDPELTPSLEGEPVDRHAGTEKGALHEKLASYGVSAPDSASEADLRKKLANAIAKSKADSEK